MKFSKLSSLTRRILGVSPLLLKGLIPCITSFATGRPRYFTTEEAIILAILRLRHNLTYEFLAFMTSSETTTVYRTVLRTTVDLANLPLIAIPEEANQAHFAYISATESVTAATHKVAYVEDLHSRTNRAFNAGLLSLPDVYLVNLKHSKAINELSVAKLEAMLTRLSYLKATIW